jgi:hypothetical protein
MLPIIKNTFAPLSPARWLTKGSATQPFVMLVDSWRIECSSDGTLTL